MNYSEVRPLERYQLVWYLLAIINGIGLGLLLPAVAGGLAQLTWPVLVLLLFTTFSQIPLHSLRSAMLDRRFLLLALCGNFVIVPMLVFALLTLVPIEPAVQLGVLLVLLVPCTDWFITFSHLGKGDSRYALALAPINLILQICLLPVYLWLFVPDTFAVAVVQKQMLLAFSVLIVLPLCLAYFTRTVVDRYSSSTSLMDKLAVLPVPLLAIVMFIISASQVSLILDSGGLLLQLLPVFVLFGLLALLLAAILGYLGRLPVLQWRVLAFSFSSRNSFVVLPLALALPAGFEITVVTIVFQSLVELFLMALFVWLVPRLYFKRTN
ncbi:MAG: arsenic resistance protein [Methylophaga sp.]|nr:arsenic resistance protein [Methylophaga sp.]